MIIEASNGVLRLEPLYLPPCYNFYFKTVDSLSSDALPPTLTELPIKRRGESLYFVVSEEIYKQPGPFVGKFDFHGVSMQRMMLPDRFFEKKINN